MYININSYNINYEMSADNISDYDILLLHGWGCNLYSLRLTYNLLKQKYRVFAVDLPGFGKSDKLNRSFCVDDYVDIVVRFIRELKIKKVCLIGHSYGGRIIIKINNLNNLSFEIVSNVFIDSAGIKTKSKVSIKSLIYKILKKVCLVLPLSKNIKEQKIENLKKYFGSYDYKNADKIMRETLVKSVNEDLSNIIKNIKVKTIIIWGENDKETPLYQARFINENIKNSVLHIIKNAGHFPFVDNAFEYENILKNYFLN